MSLPLALVRSTVNEYVPNQSSSAFAGGTQSTLQEIKLPDGAGGFAFKTDGSASNEHFWRNRFISWRSSGDNLELAEYSLDFKLRSSKVIYRFSNAPILTNGVGIFETLNHVVVLVATVGSVHKMTFPHPRKILKQQGHLVRCYLHHLIMLMSKATHFRCKTHELKAFHLCLLKPHQTMQKSSVTLLHRRVQVPCHI